MAFMRTTKEELAKDLCLYFIGYNLGEDQDCPECPLCNDRLADYRDLSLMDLSWAVKEASSILAPIYEVNANTPEDIVGCSSRWPEFRGRLG